MKKIFWYKVNRETLSEWHWYWDLVTCDFWNGAENLFLVASSQEEIEKRLPHLWLGLPIDGVLPRSEGHEPLLSFESIVSAREVNQMSTEGGGRFGFIDETRPIVEHLYNHSPVPSWLTPRSLDDLLLEDDLTKYILRERPKVSMFSKL